MTTSNILLPASDGHQVPTLQAGAIDAPRVMVLLHDYTGLNNTIRQTARRLARLGYCVLVPDLFARHAPAVALPETPVGVREGRNIAAQLSSAEWLRDLHAASRPARERPAVALGFGFGALAAWQAATGDSVLRAAIGFYPPEAIEEPAACPVQLHFGNFDQPLSPAVIEHLRSSRPDLETIVYPGTSERFACEVSEHFSSDGWELALENVQLFLRRHLPG